jgi:hypothetical protein
MSLLYRFVSQAFLMSFITVALAAGAPEGSRKAATPGAGTPEGALAELREGNRRFCAGERTRTVSSVRDGDLRATLVQGQAPGTVSGPDTVRLRSGQEVRVKRDALGGRTGSVAVGIRPEKIELGNGQVNTLDGKVIEQAYVGVATQYIVDTDCGRLTVYRQNASPGLNGAAPGQPITLSWSPDCAFVVDSMEGSE